MSTRIIRLTATTALAALAATLAAIGPPSPISAASLTVDTLSDNPADGYTLREAISDANANVGLDQIEFTDGLTGTITLTSGQLTSSDDLEINGPGAELLTIDGDGASRVLRSATPGVSLWLRDLTIANGAVIGSGGGVAFNGDRLIVNDTTFVGNEASNQGGGLWVANATALWTGITNATFDGNRSGNAGGGLYLVNNVTNGTFDLTRNSFVDNESVNGNGGGAFISGSMRTVHVSNTTVTSNTATNGDAGGMWVDGARVTVLKSAFADNVAGSQFGGATVDATNGAARVSETTFRDNTAPDVGAANISGTEKVTITDVMVEDNVSAGTAGLTSSSSGDVYVGTSTFNGNEGGTTGALHIASSMDAMIEDSTFSSNVGDLHGALNVVTNDVEIIASTFESNSADSVVGQGGAVYASGTADVRARHSTFHDNSAHEGGAIYALGGSEVNLFHVTVTENTASGEAGGVFVAAGADADFANSIVSGNAAPAFPDVNDATLEIDSSILGDSAGLVLNGAGFSVGVDPKLGPIADNGGPTRTLLPQPDSPAIDTGGVFLVAAPYVDQRGVERSDGAADIGSVEVFPDSADEVLIPDGEDPDDEQPIWTPTDPARFVDTRAVGETIDDMNEATGKFDAGEQRQITFAGRGDVPADAVGVIANITAINTTTKGFITAHACENPRPNAASLNYTSGVNLGNEIILGLDTNGDACIYTSAPLDLTIDVVGYISAESPYTPIVPARYADTRPTGITFDGAVQAGGAPGRIGELTVPIAGRGNVPADAVAVTMYLSAVTPEGNGFVTVWDCDGPNPLASSLNHVDAVNRGNEIITDIGPDGDICLFTTSNTHITIDVVGFIPDGTNYTSLADQSRFLDTRDQGVTVDDLFKGGGPVTGGEFVEFDIAGRAGIPATVSTVTMNVTAVTPTGTGYVTVYDCDELPLASSLNYIDGVNGGNEIIASVNTDGKVCLFTSTTTQLAADITGYTST